MKRTRLGRTARRAAAAAVMVGSAAPIAGCGVFSPGVDSETPATMTVSSDAIAQNDILDARYTCADRSGPVNPPLGWAGAPPGTKSFAVVVDDSNAPITPYVYWVVFDINPSTSQIAEGQLPPGARVALNSAGSARYDPPCPGSPTPHQYRFTVYALSKVLNLPSGTSLQSAWTQIAAATIGRGRAAPYASSNTH